MSNGGGKKMKMGEMALAGVAGLLGLGAVWWFFFRADATPGNVQVTLTPPDVEVGGSVTVSASFFNPDGTPRQVAAGYIKVRDLLSDKAVSITPNPTPGGSTVTATINTTGLAPGDYIVEVADNPQFA